MDTRNWLTKRLCSISCDEFSACIWGRNLLRFRLPFGASLVVLVAVMTIQTRGNEEGRMGDEVITVSKPAEEEMVTVNYAESELFNRVLEKLYSFNVDAMGYHGKLHEPEKWPDIELQPQIRPMLWILENRKENPEVIRDHLSLQNIMNAAMESVVDGLERTDHIHKWENQIEPIYQVYGQLPEQFIPNVVNELVTKTTRGLEYLLSGKDEERPDQKPMLPVFMSKTLPEYAEKFGVPDVEERFIDSVSLFLLHSISDQLESRTGRALPFEDHPKFERYFKEGAEIPEAFKMNEYPKDFSERKTKPEESEEKEVSSAEPPAPINPVSVATSVSDALKR
ncbi:MAG: hypothetical protein AAF558_09910 [Verrucomicrobiota bacterium]